MDQYVDLDSVIAALSQRRPEWARRGLVIGDFTWRDAAAPWPQPIMFDRESIIEPESLGMTLDAGGGVEGLLVLWTGGWADADAVIGGQHVVDTPTFVDVESCVAVVDAFINDLLGAGGRAEPGPR